MSADPTALLSREELGALLNSARDSLPAQSPRQVGAPESARGELRELASRFADEQGRGLSTLYQTPVHLSLAHIEEIGLRQFAAAMLDTDRVARLDLGGGREVYLLLARPLVFAWMGLSFGARPGPEPQMVLGRPYTRIELRFLSRAADGIARTLAKAMDLDPGAARVVSFEDPMALHDRAKRPHRVVTIDVDGLGETACMRIALPPSLVEDGVAELSSSSSGPSLELATQLFEAPVELHVEVGSARVGLRELGQLAVGDELRLEPASSEAGLVVNVENAARFRAEPGKLGRRLAVRITEVLHP